MSKFSSCAMSALTDVINEDDRTGAKRKAQSAKRYGQACKEQRYTRFVTHNSLRSGHICLDVKLLESSVFIKQWIIYIYIIEIIRTFI